MDLAGGIRSGDRRALARALTEIENRLPGSEALLAALAPTPGGAYRVGVTGAPGVGKSTLVLALVEMARRASLRVAVLAVDPSSPKSGGALLGDRIRMGRVLLDSGVFVRSMASRGAPGALAEAAGDLLDVLAVAGFDVVILETVGAGQSEFAFEDAVDLRLVVLAPGAGDGIQAMKSGVLEVADLFVVNKGDDPAAETVKSDVVQALSLAEGHEDPEPRVAIVSARTGAGIAKLWARIDQRRLAGPATGEREARTARRSASRILALAETALRHAAAEAAPPEPVTAISAGARAAALLRRAAERMERDGGRT